MSKFGDMWNLTKGCCRYIYTIVGCALVILGNTFLVVFFFGIFLGSLGYPRIFRILTVSKNM